jgi:hypothetical protein
MSNKSYICVTNNKAARCKPDNFSDNNNIVTIHNFFLSNIWRRLTRNQKEEFFEKGVINIS